MIKKKLPHTLKILGFVLVAIGLVSIGGLGVYYIGYRSVGQVFSQYTLLTSSWDQYKRQFIQNDGRVIDYSAEGVTTSEGQSYALLRSVWSDDQATFDVVWNWTKTNLKRPEDNLFGWLWGKREDGSYGPLDTNAASDADQDIALAMIFASDRWSRPEYLEVAKGIMTDLWQKEVTKVGDIHYLIAGNWAQNDDVVVVNPSYFAPYAWRVFATYDPDHDWNSLIDPAYALLEKSGSEQLDAEQGVGLPPNWVMINRKTNALSPVPSNNLKTEYSYDAVRIPWRVALDYYWFKDEQARKYLVTQLAPLSTKYKLDDRLVSTYSHSGQPITDYESPTMYATLLPALKIDDPCTAQRVYEDKILKLYSADDNGFRADLPYYEQNWLWFGSALYLDQLPLLARRSVSDNTRTNSQRPC